jgi:hypothetical protein
LADARRELEAAVHAVATRSAQVNGLLSKGMTQQHKVRMGAKLKAEEREAQAEVTRLEAEMEEAIESSKRLHSRVDRGSKLGNTGRMVHSETKPFFQAQKLAKQLQDQLTAAKTRLEKANAAVAAGPSLAELEADLRKEYPMAELNKAEAAAHSKLGVVEKAVKKAADELAAAEAASKSADTLAAEAVEALARAEADRAALAPGPDRLAQMATEVEERVQRELEEALRSAEQLASEAISQLRANVLCAFEAVGALARDEGDRWDGAPPAACGFKSQALDALPDEALEADALDEAFFEAVLAEASGCLQYLESAKARKEAEAKAAAERAERERQEAKAAQKAAKKAAQLKAAEERAAKKALELQARAQQAAARPQPGQPKALAAAPPLPPEAPLAALAGTREQLQEQELARLAREPVQPESAIKGWQPHSTQPLLAEEEAAVNARRRLDAERAADAREASLAAAAKAKQLPLRIEVDQRPPVAAAVGAEAQSHAFPPSMLMPSRIEAPGIALPANASVLRVQQPPNRAQDEAPQAGVCTDPMMIGRPARAAKTPQAALSALAEVAEQSAADALSGADVGAGVIGHAAPQARDDSSPAPALKPAPKPAPKPKAACSPWQGRLDAHTGRIYFWHTHTRETRWELPEAARAVVLKFGLDVPGTDDPEATDVATRWSQTEARPTLCSAAVQTSADPVAPRALPAAGSSSQRGGLGASMWEERAPDASWESAVRTGHERLGELAAGEAFNAPPSTLLDPWSPMEGTPGRFFTPLNPVARETAIVPPQPAPPVAPPRPAVPEDDGSWSCSECTFVNANAHGLVCEVCATIRDPRHGL